MGAHHEKCIKRPVQIVGKNVKFRLNRMVPNLCIAGNVISNIGQNDSNKTMNPS
jgi:hypothetical protein